MKNSDIEDLNKLIKKNNEKLRSKTSYLLSKIHDLEKKVLILEKKSIKIPLLTTNIMNNKFVKIAIVAAVIIGGLLAYKKINAAELHGSFSASYNSELQSVGFRKVEKTSKAHLILPSHWVALKLAWMAW